MENVLFRGAITTPLEKLMIILQRLGLLVKNIGQLQVNIPVIEQGVHRRTKRNFAKADKHLEGKWYFVSTKELARCE
jgi:hypothetical protein